MAKTKVTVAEAFSDLIKANDNLPLLNHLLDLYEAEKEGRLMVLPCKPGKKAYLVHDLRETEFPSVADITGPYDVYDVTSKGFWMRSKRGNSVFVRWYEVGKKAFWSKQKAEAARDAIIAEDNNVPTKKEE